MVYDINDLIRLADKAFFECYGDFNEGGNIQHMVMTCTQGQFNGEVIDIYYKYNTGIVTKVEHSTQFKGQQPLFTFNQSANPVLVH